ncbi:MAG: molybdenum cofactor cytidylyltransferase [Thermodesulfobacteriota bacterium]
MISAILLGAGESKRMGFDKLSLPWGKKTVLERCVQTLLRSRVREVVIVRGLRSRGVRNTFHAKKIKIVTNPHPAGGMSSSIRQGLRAVRPGSDGILIALGDQPFLKTRTINALIRIFDRGKERIIVPAFQGKTGHPVIFDKVYKKELMNLKGDVGGRSIIERHREDVRVVKVRSMGVVKDVDTWQDYEKDRKKVAVKRKRVEKGFR